MAANRNESLSHMVRPGGALSSLLMDNEDASEEEAHLVRPQPHPVKITETHIEVRHGAGLGTANDPASPGHPIHGEMPEQPRTHVHPLPKYDSMKRQMDPKKDPKTPPATPVEQ